MAHNTNKLIMSSKSPSTAVDVGIIELCSVVFTRITESLRKIFFSKSSISTSYSRVLGLNYLCLGYTSQLAVETKLKRKTKEVVGR